MLRGIRRDLEREIDAEAYAVLFKEFRRRSAHARTFNGWRELVACFHSRTMSAEAEEAILRDCFAWHAKDQNPLCRTVLTLVFFPMLVSILGRTRRWRIAPEDLWSNLHWAFVQTLMKFDAGSCETGIFLKVYRDTLGRLRRLCKNEWKHVERETAAGDLAFAADDLGAPDPGLAAIEKREETEHLIVRLRRLASAGVISDDDLALVLETRVYGIGLEDAAKARDLTYCAANSRRHRAERVIRRHLREP